MEYGLEPHRLVHLLGYLRNKDAFSQVFVTTHSPTALLHLEPQELMMVRSTAGGTTQVRSLGDPSSLRPLLKRCPEAFLSRRVVINEGKTEYGVVLRLLQEWDYGPAPEAVPAAALGGGGVGGRRRHRIGEVGQGVPRRRVRGGVVHRQRRPGRERDGARRQQLGGTVIQWPGGVCIESAVCSQLDAAGLNAYIAAALEVADDPAASRQSFTDHLGRYAVPERRHAGGSQHPRHDHLDGRRHQPGRVPDRGRAGVEGEGLVQARRQGPTAGHVHP